MSNTINILDDVVMTTTIDAFTSVLYPINAFSTNFAPEPSQPASTVSVGIVPEMSAIDFAGTYVANGDTTITEVEVSLSEHKLVPVHMSDVDASQSSIAHIENVTGQAAKALAKGILVDCMGAIVSASYSNSVVKTAGNFTLDEVATLRGDAATLGMGDVRSLVIAPDYSANLLTDANISDASAFGGTEAVREGKIARLMGFDIYECDCIPANSQSLEGFIAVPEAMAICVRPLLTQSSASYLLDEVVTDEKTGVSFSYRKFFDVTTGKLWATFEAIHGKKVCIGDGIKRITSA